MNAEIKYGGFWRRFGAFWLDSLFLAPLGLLSYFATRHFRLFSLYYLVPGMLIGAFYNVYLVRRFGGTPGKLVAGLRIVKVDGTPIGRREAVLRFLPEFLLSESLAIGLTQSILKMSDSEYLGLGFLQQAQHIIEMAPSWVKPTQTLENVWIWSEFIVLLTNRKRRAIHDFIAGTVVIVSNPNQSSDPAPSIVTTPAGQESFRF